MYVCQFNIVTHASFSQFFESFVADELYRLFVGFLADLLFSMPDSACAFATKSSLPGNNGCLLPKK